MRRNNNLSRNSLNNSRKKANLNKQYVNNNRNNFMLHRNRKSPQESSINGSNISNQYDDDNNIINDEMDDDLYDSEFDQIDNNQNYIATNNMDESFDDEDSDHKVKLRISLRIKIIIYSIVFLIIIALIIIFFAIIVSIFGGLDVSATLPSGSELLRCPQLVVKQCRYKYEDGETRKSEDSVCAGNRDKAIEEYVYRYDGEFIIPLETYVAGVIAGEVGDLPNDEVWKAWAVIARTYALVHASEDCKIESSDFYQVMYTDTPGQVYKNMAEETKNVVILNDNNDLFNYVSYDMFACVGKITSGDKEYYVLNQPVSERQKIPVSYVEESGKIRDKFIQQCYTRMAVNHHGNGASQFGAYYLAEKLKYDYVDILFYYYGDYAHGELDGSKQNKYNLFCNRNTYDFGVEDTISYCQSKSFKEWSDEIEIIVDNDK